MRFAASAFAILIALAALQGTPTAAQDWPTQAIKIVTPFPPGSGGDVTARLFADAIAKRCGKPVIVENRSGADGILAVNALVSSSDGHTILYTNGGPLTSNQLSHAGKLPYDAARDLAAISGGAEVFVAIGVPSSLSVGTLDEFIKMARSRPGQLNWGATPGTLDYLLPGFFAQAGLHMARIPYRDVASAMQDLSQARLHFYVASLATQLPLAQSGAAKIIAVTNRSRAPANPEFATTQELGVSDLTYEAFLGFFGPRSMPAAIRDRISADIRAIGADDALAKKFETIGMKVRVTTPAELDSLVAAERAALAKMTAITAPGASR